MILTYSLDRFVSAIQSGTKIHTIRTDWARRWKPGMSIQHWRGNPRNVRANPYQFAAGTCISVQEIFMFQFKREYHPETFGFGVMVDNRHISKEEIEALAINDGLSVAEFKAWFFPPGVEEFTGRIIHFTEKKY